MAFGTCWSRWPKREVSDLLRMSVLLFGGAATALAVVSVVGAGRADSNTLVYVAAVWWCLATLDRLWLAPRPMTTAGIAGLLAESRQANALPELEPGTVLFNRLWPLIVLALASAVIGFFFLRCRPWPPATACSSRCCGESRRARSRPSKAATVWSSGSTRPRPSVAPSAAPARAGKIEHEPQH